jgi:anti-sigma regulatory factor (Ser/Thr protein kinase)
MGTTMQRTGDGDAADPEDGTMPPGPPGQHADVPPRAAPAPAECNERVCEPAPGVRQVTEDLLPVVHAARHARNVVTDACLRWHLDHLVGPAALIVSELVSNVVEHAHTIMTLRVSVCGSCLRLAVHDGNTLPPVLRLGDAARSGGLGLRLVASTGTQWGYTRQDDGKEVWATLATRSAAPE